MMKNTDRIIKFVFIFFFIYRRYMLEPEISNDDEHYLLSNGSIFGVNHSPSMLAPGIDYCIELVPGRGLRTLVCFHKGRKK